MNYRIQLSPFAGIIATAVMTLVMIVAPKMLPPQMLAGMVRIPVVVA